MDSSNKQLNYDQFKNEAKDSKIVDTRLHIDEGVVSGAINVAQGPMFEKFIMNLFTPEQKIVLITDEGKEQEAIQRLNQIGYTNTIGYLNGGFKSYSEAGGEFGVVKIVELNEFLDFGNDPEKHQILDVRSASEYQSGHFQGAINIEYNLLQEQFFRVPKDKILHIHCQQGGRAKIAMTILRNRGFENFVIVKQGGCQTIADANQYINLCKDKILHIHCKLAGRAAKTAMTILRNKGFDKFVIVRQGGYESISEAYQNQL